MIEKMQTSDLECIEDLEKLCFKEPWNLKQLKNELDLNPFSNGWILKQDHHIVAYAFLWETFEMAQLARIGVDPKYRNKGLAKEMMNKLFEIALSNGCEYMTLEVRESNLSAIGLYRSIGFEKVNVAKGYYSDNENAIVMTRAL